MTITHQQLRDIVGETPEPWWPEIHGDELWLPELAYAAFVGAAVEWLGRQGKPYDCPAFYFYENRWFVDYGNGEGTDSPCLLSALIAACRAVKKEQEQ